MEEELKISIEMMRKEKEKILENIRDKDISAEERLNCINQIAKIDELMFNYFQKINNIKKTNISIEEKNIPINKVPNKNFKNKRNNNNDDNSNNKANSEENDELSDDFIESENKLLIKKTKKTKNNSLEILDLTDEEKKEIFINNKYVPLIKYIAKTKTKTKYIFKSKSKNYIFYKCKLNKNCEGRGKIDIKNKTFIVTKYCNNKSEHEIISYIDFVDLFQKKEYNKIDFSNKKNNVK